MFPRLTKRRVETGAIADVNRVVVVVFFKMETTDCLSLIRGSCAATKSFRDWRRGDEPRSSATQPSSMSMQRTHGWHQVEIFISFCGSAIMIVVLLHGAACIHCEIGITLYGGTSRFDFRFDNTTSTAVATILFAWRLAPKPKLLLNVAGF